MNHLRRHAGKDVDLRVAREEIKRESGRNRKKNKKKIKRYFKGIIIYLQKVFSPSS